MIALLQVLQMNHLIIVSFLLIDFLALYRTFFHLTTLCLSWPYFLQRAKQTVSLKGWPLVDWWVYLHAFVLNWVA